jgi:DNA-binding transcriptional LysR family regulator
LADLTSLNLNLLVALDALLTERSVTRAGRKIGLAQSSMSHALASLRELFGDPLLVRSARGMVPTPRARELEAPLRRALDMLETAIDTPTPFDPATASLTFGLASDAVQQVILLPGVFRVLQECAPGIALHTEAPVDAKQTCGKLANGELDFAIGHFDDPPTDVHRRHLASDRIVYVARKGHPRISRTLSKATMRAERMLLPTPITSGEPPSSLLSFHQSRDTSSAGLLVSGLPDRRHHRHGRTGGRDVRGRSRSFGLSGTGGDAARRHAHRLARPNGSLAGPPLATRPVGGTRSHVHKETAAPISALMHLKFSEQTKDEFKLHSIETDG